MVWVFLIVTPSAIMIARYGRYRLPARWLQMHATLMVVLAGLPLIAAFVLGYEAATPDNFSSTHTVGGFLLFRLFLFLLGRIQFSKLAK